MLFCICKNVMYPRTLDTERSEPRSSLFQYTMLHIWLFSSVCITWIGIRPTLVAWTDLIRYIIFKGKGSFVSSSKQDCLTIHYDKPGQMCLKMTDNILKSVLIFTGSSEGEHILMHRITHLFDWWFFF